MKVLGTRVLVKVINEEIKTASGLVIASSSGADVDANVKGTILSVGRGFLLDSGVWVGLDVKVGDKVLVNKFSGAEVSDPLDDKVKLMVINEKDILLVYDKA